MYIWCRDNKLYYNDGFGRLNNFPDYREKITRGKYVHKDDYVNLKIRSSYLLLPTDNQYHFAFNDVTFTKPTEEEFVNLFLQRIKTKNERANQYDKLNVKWLELIISDENGYFDDGSVLSKTNQQKLIDEVKKSKFQTVYILSTYKGIGSLQVIGDIPKFLLKNNL